MALVSVPREGGRKTMTQTESLRLPWRFQILILALVATRTWMFSQSSESSEIRTATLDELVLTAPRSETRLFDTPYTATVIDREQFERRTYSTTPQMLRDVTGIMIQETSIGQGSPNWMDNQSEFPVDCLNRQRH